MSKKYKFNLGITPTLTRALVYNSYMGKPINFAILYDKKTSALQFQVDTRNPLILSGQVVVQMFRNLENCRFCRTFFNLETVSSDVCDFRGKFAGINRQYELHLFKFLNEKLDMQLNEERKISQNYLLTLGWKIHGFEEDLQFFFVQRKCYNKVTRVNIIRTAGLQFATKRGLEAIEKYNSDYENSFKKVRPIDVPDFLEDQDIDREKTDT